MHTVIRLLTIIGPALARERASWSASIEQLRLTLY